MKKISAPILLIFAALFNLSCDENFNPKTNFQEKYFLFCIIEADGNFAPYAQNAVVSRLYDVEGYDPSVNTQDPSVSGACVLLSYKDNNYVMEENTAKRAGSTGYDSTQIYYSCNSPDLTLHPYDKVSINARLARGTVLTGSTTLPGYIDFKFSYPFVHGITTLIDKFRWGKSWTISWNTNENYIFFPRMILNYTIQDSNLTQYFSREIPTKIINNNGKNVPIYPGYTYEKSISYDYDAIDSVMKQISIGDSIKYHYKNFSMIFTLKECDNNLSKYYPSVHGFLDDYSISFNEYVYSNIKGGAGIVGSIINFNKSFGLDIYYLRTFGYLK